MKKDHPMEIKIAFESCRILPMPLDAQVWPVQSRRGMSAPIDRPLSATAICMKAHFDKRLLRIS
jgi:hypothetical protein